jgi:hypothetical protein
VRIGPFRGRAQLLALAKFQTGRPPSARQQIRARLQDTAEHDEFSEVRRDAQWAIDQMA